MPQVMLEQRLCTASCTEACTVHFCNGPACHGVMKADLRIVVKDCRRKKTLRISLVQVPFVARQFFVRMSPETEFNAKTQGGKDAKGWVASSQRALRLGIFAPLR